MKEITVDFICQTLSDNDGLLGDWVCDTLQDDETERDICLEVCEYAYPQCQCYKRYFEFVRSKQT